MLSNREYALSWTWEELGTISDEVEPPHRIRLESVHKVWKNRVFRIPKKVIPVEKEMIEERVWQGLFEPAWGPYRNAHFLVPKKNGKYRFIISGVSANWHTLEDAGIPPNVEEFSEAFTGLPISSLIECHSGYDQKRLHEDSRDYMAFQTTQGLYRPTRLVQGATNSVSAFVRAENTKRSPGISCGNISRRCRSERPKESVRRRGGGTVACSSKVCYGTPPEP